MCKDRARDVLGELTIRRTLGERLAARVGRRAWSRPRVAVSGRIFRLYRLADPWDPESKPEESLNLGPVSLRLGEGRRQPARHLAPKDDKPPPSKQPAGDPVAKWRRPEGEAAPPQAAPRPAPRPIPPPAAETEGLFGKRAEKKALRGNLPVRPELARPAADAPVEVAAVAEAPRTLPPVRRGPAEVEGKRRAGRFSMRPVQVAGPVYEEVTVAPDPAADEGPGFPEEATPEEATAAPAPAAAPPKPEPRRLPSASGGLDDLFGMPMEGRMSFRPKKKAPDEA